MRRVNPENLEIETIKNKGEIVWILSSIDSMVNYDQELELEIYSNFKTALKNFNTKVKEATDEMQSWFENDLENLSKDIDIDEQNEEARFDIYDKDEYDRFHITINISKREVM